MRLVLSVALLSITAIQVAAQARIRPSNLVQLRILSADSTRPVTAHVRLSGDALYSLGATRAPGQGASSSTPPRVIPRWCCWRPKAPVPKPGCMPAAIRWRWFVTRRAISG
jgi:hypothetical protein